MRFADGISWLETQGVKSFIELGPDGVLSTIVREYLDERETTDGAKGATNPNPNPNPNSDPNSGSPRDTGPAVVMPSLRAERPEAQTLLNALSELWVNGTTINWAEIFRGLNAERVSLPAYAFQRERYWLASETLGAGDMVAAGQASAGHPLLGAAVVLADERGWLFTGRISLESHPWLADHAVLGTVLLPGTAFVELALHVGREAGCPVIEELTLQAPLALPEQGAVVLQLGVGELDEDGKRSLVIHSHVQEPESSGESSLFAGQWTHHATGVLSSGAALSTRQATIAGRTAAVRERGGALAEELWPPAGSEVLKVDGLYDALTGMGLEYGPVFQGVRAAWRRGDEVFAEVALPESQHDRASSFGVHPALLDAALHAGAVNLTDADGKPGQERGEVAVTRLPFSWTGVELHASGASSLRVSLARSGSDAISLLVADEAGGLVASVDALVSRALSAEHLSGALGGAHGDALFSMDWPVLPLSAQASPTDLVLLGVEDATLGETLTEAGHAVAAHADLRSLRESLDAAADVVNGDAAPELVLVDCMPAGAESLVDALHQGAHRILELLQDWLSDERFANTRLALITRGAVAAGSGEVSPGPLPGAHVGSGALRPDGDPGTVRARRHR